MFFTSHFLLFYFLCLHFPLSLQQPHNRSLTSEEQLIEYVLSQHPYKTARPVLNPEHTTHVNVTSTIFKIEQLNEALELITIKEWFGVEFDNEFIKWDPADYENIQKINVLPSDIWLPDVYAEYALSVHSIYPPETLLAEIHHNGHVVAVTARSVTLSCPVNMTNYPFDVQTCENVYSPWTLTADKQMLHADNLSLNLRNINNTYDSHREWKLLNYSVTEQHKHYEKWNMTLPRLHFRLYLAREPGHHIMSFMWPVNLISTLVIIGLFSPSNHTKMRKEKISMGLGALLFILFIFESVTDRLPKGHGQLPKLCW